jgi:hypothetical protein
VLSNTFWIQRDLGLRIEPKLPKSADEPWDLVCYCDSNFAGDPDTRRSVSGYIIYVKGVPICWRSKAQRSITLSSSEAEWIALSEATKEIMFVLQLSENMHIKVDSQLQCVWISLEPFGYLKMLIHRAAQNMLIFV